MAIFSDISVNLPDSKPLAEDVTSVIQALFCILGTNFKERYFRPEIGADLEDHIYDPEDDITAFNILDEIFTVLEKFEPRVTVDFSQSSVIPDVNKNEFYVTLVLKIQAMGNYYFSVGATLKL